VTGAGARGITVTGVRGLIGDGKIWVADVDSVVRVRTRRARPRRRVRQIAGWRRRCTPGPAAASGRPRSARSPAWAGRPVPRRSARRVACRPSGAAWP